MVRVLVLGVGDAFSARYYSSSVSVEAEGQWLLIDCPHPIRKILREAGAVAGIPIDLDRIAGAIVTHLHADHASGLEGYGFYSRYILDRPASLLLHPTLANEFWTTSLFGGMGTSWDGPGTERRIRDREDIFKVTELSETVSTPFGPFSIECRPTFHSVPTFALRIRAGGKTLGFSADTAFDPKLIDWLSPADLIIHETNPGYMHTPYEALISLPTSIRTKMRLIHFADDFDTTGCAIRALRQGEVIEL